MRSTTLPHCYLMGILLAALNVLPLLAAASEGPSWQASDTPVITQGVEEASPTTCATPELRIALVGGLVLSGVWPNLATSLGDALGLDVHIIAAAPKEQVVPLFATGKADVLLIHGGDETLQLEARPRPPGPGLGLQRTRHRRSSQRSCTGTQRRRWKHGNAPDRCRRRPFYRFP